MSPVVSLAMRISPRSAAKRKRTAVDSVDAPPSPLTVNTPVSSPSLLSRLDQRPFEQAVVPSPMCLLDRIQKSPADTAVTGSDPKPSSLAQRLGPTLDDVDTSTLQVDGINVPPPEDSPDTEQQKAHSVKRSEVPSGSATASPFQFLTTEAFAADLSQRPPEAFVSSPDSEAVVDSLLHFTDSEETDDVFPDRSASRKSSVPLVEQNSSPKAARTTPNTAFVEQPNPQLDDSMAMVTPPTISAIGAQHTSSDVSYHPTSDVPPRESSPSPHVPPIAAPSAIEQCRTALVPVILQNASRRKDRAGSQPTTDDVGALLTDQRCVDFIAQAKKVQQQLASRKNRDSKNEDHTKDFGSKRAGRDRGDTSGRAMMYSGVSDHGFHDRSREERSSRGQPFVSKSPTTMSRKTSYISDSSSILFATPMRDNAQGGIKRASHVSRRSPSSPYYSHSPPRPYTASADMQHFSDGIDPVLRASQSRGKKRIRHTSADDVHSSSSRQAPRPISRSPSTDCCLASIINNNGTDHDVPSHNRLCAQPQTATVPPPTHVIFPPTQANNNNIVQQHDPATGLKWAIPGLWLAQMGLPQPDIIDLPLEIGSDILPSNSHDNVSNPVVFHLICLTAKLVLQKYQALDPAASSETIASTMWSIRSPWPLAGKLIVEVNSEQSWGRSWLPIDLIRAGSCIDVTPHLRAGTNRLRFIQLGDLSEHMFVLHASRAPKVPPPSNHVAGERHPVKGSALNGSADPRGREEKEAVDVKVDEYLTHLRKVQLKTGTSDSDQRARNRASVFDFGQR